MNNLPQIFDFQDPETYEALESTIESLKRMIKTDQETIDRVFGSLDDVCFGEVFNTAQHIDREMRACVYFIRNEYNGMIKIGKTKNLSRRIQQIGAHFMQCGLEPKLKIVMLHLTFPRFITKLENYYHTRFKNNRKYGEWFNVDAKKLTDVDNFGDGFEFMGNDGTLVCFEEYEQLAIEKGTTKICLKHDADFYMDYLKFDPAIKLCVHECLHETHNNQKPQLMFEVLKKYNNSLSALYLLRDKQLCVQTLSDIGFLRVGCVNAEPISFSELKRNKFYEDYSYWENLINVINKEK